jgi:hypothetical protein
MNNPEGCLSGRFISYLPMVYIKSEKSLREKLKVAGKPPVVLPIIDSLR